MTPPDPINEADLDGQAKKKPWWKKRSFWKGAVKVAGFAAIGACVVLTAGACAVAAAGAFAASAAMRTYEYVKDKQYRQRGGTARYVGGLFGDLFAARIPGVRYVSKWVKPRHVTQFARHKAIPMYHSLRSSLRTGRGWRNLALNGAGAGWIQSGL